MIRIPGRDHESFSGVTAAANLCEILSNSSIYAKLPNHGRGWGVHVRSDIEIYLNVLELIHAAAGGEGVKVLFRILSGHSKGSELAVNAQIPQSLIAACSVDKVNNLR
jgi:hypothetical protein